MTNNLKDFPEEYVDTFGMKAKSVDDSLTDIVDLNQKQAIKAFRELVLNRKNPAMDEYQLLESLRRNGLMDTANYLYVLL
ncbi:hypothetical protein [Pedobacter miscanthi]|uniref:hypothetical protein n=1 Tax=Pedobacter miscanthi TaxID=2259170 RepID=UPI001ABFB632|nr:hypothetical protein [Pedobacter miscanthi]